MIWCPLKNLKLLTNDPDGDVAAYGELGAWIMMIFRIIRTLFICALVFAFIMGILLGIAAVAKITIAFFALFMSPVPFLER